jgi:hypothetical protein
MIKAIAAAVLAAGLLVAGTAAAASASSGPSGSHGQCAVSSQPDPGCASGGGNG